MTLAPSTEEKPPSPWVAMGLILSGSFLLGLDRTIVNVVLPQIGLEFAESGGLDIVVSGYFISVGVAQPGTGWLADRFGKKPVYLTALGLFTVASLLAGLAPTLPLLLVARILQGLCGGAMMPLSLAMVYELFPPERRGRAFGVWGIFAMISPALGPVVGGGISTAVSWRWAFLLNVPIGLIVLPVAVRYLRDPSGKGQRRLLDWQSWMLAGGGLPMLLFGVSRAGDSGWLEPRTLGLILGGVILVALFVTRSRRVVHPLLDFEMLRIPSFSATMIIQWLVSVPYTSQMVLVPLLLVTFRGMTPLDAGLIVTPSALGSMTLMRVAGRWVDRSGVRPPTVVGAGLLTVSTLLLAAFGPTASVGGLVAIMVVQGMGAGMSLMPLTVAALDAVPEELLSQASAMRALNKMTAQAVGVSAMTTLLASRLGDSRIIEATLADLDRAAAAYTFVFLSMAVLLGMGVVLSLRLPRHRARKTAPASASKVTSGAGTAPGARSSDAEASDSAEGAVVQGADG